jgi:hypothetical protein
MSKGKRGGQLHPNRHKPTDYDHRIMTDSSKHRHYHQPPTPTMTCHVPTAPPHPPPSATTTTRLRESHRTPQKEPPPMPVAHNLRRGSRHQTHHITPPRWSTTTSRGTPHCRHGGRERPHARSPLPTEEDADDGHCNLPRGPKSSPHIAAFPLLGLS